MDGLTFSKDGKVTDLDGKRIGEWIAPRELQPRFTNLKQIEDALRVGIYGPLSYENPNRPGHGAHGPLL